MPVYNYAIATGWNNAGGLVNVELLAAGGEAFPPPYAASAWDDGDVRVRLDGLTSAAGMASVTWLFDSLLLAQVQYLHTTYAAGGLSGKVTVRTVKLDGTYGNYNAIMRLPKTAELRRQFEWVDDVEVTLMLKAAL